MSGTHQRATPIAAEAEEERKIHPGTAAAKKMGWFPLTYKEGFAQWWESVSPAAAEAAVLRFLPFNHPGPATAVDHPHSERTPKLDPHGQRECKSELVPLSGNDRVLNEFSITRMEEEKKEDLVILHGYGAGLAFFYKNFDGLSSVPGWKLWALDLLGYGRSSRPPFKIHAKEPEAKIREAEAWFIDALEEWRIKRGLEKFTLLGHSLGGYLAVSYALKYPGHLKKLILASPVGVPEDPYSVRTEPLKSDPPKDTAEQEFADQDIPTNPPPRRPLPKWLTYLWDANVSPFSFVRWSGPLGPRLVSGWTSRRFGILPEDEAKALHTYAYSLFRQRGSGEYALAYLLAPAAFARDPLIRRIHKLGTLGVPTVFLYGELDWMDVGGGLEAEHKIRTTEVQDEEGRKWWRGGREWVGSETEHGDRSGKKGEAKVRIVTRAGHHLYLENADEFNGFIKEEMRDVEERGKMAAARE